MRVLAVLLLAACGSDGSTEQPLFPADYAATYQQVRNCRYSIEHDLQYIRVLVSPDALTPYNGRTAPFPAGSIVLKEQYDGDDTTCAGPIVQWTVMQKLATGTDADNLDWEWQRVDAKKKITTGDIKKCTTCHKACIAPPDGYDGTCTMP